MPAIAGRGLCAVALLIAALPGQALADYLCKPMDVPGSSYTQLLGLNNNGQLVAASDFGGSIYSGGAWTTLPDPLASSGYLGTDLNPVAINDAGIIAGAAVSSTTFASQGFLLTGSGYQFISYQPGTWPDTAFRGLADNGNLSGVASDSGSATAVVFVYNPGAPNQYPSGFTEIVPVLNGQPAARGTPGSINALGQLVGNSNFPGQGKWGFVYDPATGVPALFQIAGQPTAPRGINDQGYVVGFIGPDANGLLAGFLLTSAGYQLITCPELPATQGVLLDGIDNSGVVVGQWFDDTTIHGFIAYPDVELPVASSNGAFVFDAAVSPNTPVFLDPAPAVGYQYALGAGDPRFTSVRLPIGIGGNVYTVIVQRPGAGERGHHEDDRDGGAARRAFTIAGGEKLDFTRSGFPGGVARFEVLGIDAGANLDPADSSAFVTEVTFGPGGKGRFTGTMTPMTASGELEDLRRGAEESGVSDKLAADVRRAQAAYDRGDGRAACKALGALVRDASGRARGDDQAAARALAAEAEAIEQALACPPN